MIRTRSQDRQKAVVGIGLAAGAITGGATYGGHEAVMRISERFLSPSVHSVDPKALRTARKASRAVALRRSSLAGLVPMAAASSYLLYKRLRGGGE